ncbi:MAG: InlB B-repeat-containing protein, partial [Bacteroidaceae bacterium]|nr:InlB B-repeat-containing protein [Bacteroidaceae bacterium]
MKKKLISVLLVAVMLLTCIPLGSVSVSAASGEYAIFPGNVLKVTQGAYGEYNSFSHNGQTGFYQNAFDLSGNANYFAPFSGTITSIKTSYNAVVLQSDEKVYWANGTFDYMSVTFVHDNDISNLYEGKHIAQGEVFYQPGEKGYSAGAHLHICVNKGKTNEGIRYFSGDVRPNEAFYLGNSVTIQQTGNYQWKKQQEIHTTHNYNTYVYYWAEHPHYKCYKCSCGDVKANYSERTYVSTCETCNSSATIATGTYVIKNNARNQYLNVAYGEDKNAANITVGDFGNWYSQYYEITPSTTTSGYAMRPLCSNTRMVNVYADTVASGKNVCLWDNTGHNSQRWNFEKVSGGYVIHNVQSPSCVLDVEGYGNAYVATYTGAASQIWSIQNAIKYNANGGSNAPATQFKDYDSSIKLSAQKPTRAGYTFLGWAESDSAKTAKYAAGDTYTARENVNLYAVWAKPTYANILSVPSTARYAKKGAKVTVPIKAEGDGLKYTWYIKNEGQTKYSKSSVTSATYSATMSSKSKNRRVYCIVKDKYNNSERSKTFILRESVSVITQPKSVTVKKNATAKATVKASGDGLRYQWYVKNAGQSKYSKSSITTATYSAKMTSK